MRKSIVILSLLFSIPVLAQEATTLNEKLDDVVITATGTPHTLKNVPVQTEIISRKQIEQLGAASFEDILSQLSSGFDFNPGDMGSQMTLNGLGNNYILIMIDGKRLNGDNGGENDLGRIDPHNIDHIEIVKGAGSALYGSDAIAGVVNIITRRHDDQALYLENTTRAGSYKDLRQHNSIGFSLGKFTSLTAFQIQHTDGWQNTGEENPAETKGAPIYDSRNKTVNMYTNGQLSQRITYNPNSRLSFEADGYLYRKRIYRPTDGIHRGIDINLYDLKYRDAGASLGTEFRLNDTDYLTFDIDWNRHAYYYHYTAEVTWQDGYLPTGELTHDYPYFRDQENLQSDQQRTMSELKGIFSLPYSNLINVGAEYRYDYLNAPMRVSNGEANDWTAALYMQDEFTGLDWLNITAGIRFIDNKAFGFHATPKVSAMFKVSDFRIRTGWSKGFKSPTPKEQDYHYIRPMGGTQYLYLGNPDLKAQTSDYLSASIEFSHKGLSASVTGYRNILENMITLVNVDVSQIPIGTAEYTGDGSERIVPRMYMNMENAQTSGIDVSVTWRINSEFTLGGSYSWLDTKANIYNTDHSRLEEVTIDGMANHKGNIYSTWQHRFNDAYRLGLGISGRARSTRYYQNNGNGKPYQIWKLTTTHDIGRSKKGLIWRVEAGIDNILNYKETTPHGLHYGTTTPGRTFYCTFSLKFSKGKKINTKDVERGSLDEDD